MWVGLFASQPGDGAMSDLKTELEKGISEAQALVDDVKVRVHLAGMDAKDEWNKLEPKVTAQLTSLKRDLSSATKDAVDDLVGALEKLRAKL